MSTSLILKNLSNEDYHHSPKYKEYISSSQLKNYIISPAEYKKSLEEPKEETPAMKLGSLVHDAMEYIHSTGDFSLSVWHDSKAVFEPPINPTTGAAFGPTAKKYQEAYTEFLKNNEGKQIASKEDLNIAHAIARSVENDPILSKVILKGESEVSHFLTTEEVGFKTRPDLETSKQIWDWKTFGDQFTKDKLLRRIVDSGYDIQAAMYQWMCHEESGQWKPFYMAFLQTVEPYGVCIVSLNSLAYTVIDGDMVNNLTHGARQFEILKDMHIRCATRNDFPSSEIYVKPDEKGRRIIEFDVPSWVNNAVVEPYFED